ncbi:MAG TPA: hypothetical protein ENG03_07030 [Thioploca sp.]|nr:MAG: hypothetical protein DRR19_03405 [Gammaproteobacteria bacterium]HDN26837.1 hypothetical protein [Thioploca sp.]
MNIIKASAVVGLVVTILTVFVEIASPEIRCWLGFDICQESLSPPLLSSNHSVLTVLKKRLSELKHRLDNTSSNHHQDFQALQTEINQLQVEIDTLKQRLAEQQNISPSQPLSQSSKPLINPSQKEPDNNYQDYFYSDAPSEGLTHPSNPWINNTLQDDDISQPHSSSDYCHYFPDDVDCK